MGDFNMEEDRDADAIEMGSASTDRERMIEAYAKVCAALGSTAAGGLQDAYTITHPEGGATSRQRRRIDRILVDPRMIGELPGLVDAGYVSRHELQVRGRNDKLKKSPDHHAARAVLRVSDTERPEPSPRYDMRKLSGDRAAEVEAAVLPLLSDDTCDPARTEGLVTHVTAKLFDRFRKEDRKSRNKERYALISKLDDCEAALRAARGDAARCKGLKAQIQRHARKLQQHMERVALAHGQCRQRQRWQRERGATKALFDTIKPEPLINLPLDTIKVTHADGSETVAQEMCTWLDAVPARWHCYLPPAMATTLPARPRTWPTIPPAIAYT